MKKLLFKVALAVIVIAGVSIQKSNADQPATPDCVGDANVCYFMQGPDGDVLAPDGVLTYPN